MADLEFFRTLFALKDEERAGWVHRDIRDPETVAGHTFGTAMLAMLLAGDEPDVDTDAAVKMALVHDVHESVSGDIRKQDDMSAEAKAAKEAAEEAGYEQLMALLDGDDLDGAGIDRWWRRYEARDDVTTRFVKDMDLLDMALQAYLYASDERYEDTERFYQEHGDLDEFFTYAASRLWTDAAKQLFDRIRSAYEGETDG